MGPAHFFAPLHVHRVVGVVQAVDVLRARCDGQRKGVQVVPFHAVIVAAGQARSVKGLTVGGFLIAGVKRQ